MQPRSETGSKLGCGGGEGGLFVVNFTVILVYIVVRCKIIQNSHDIEL